MKIFVDKDREKKREAYIKKLKADPELAKESLYKAGITTKNGKLKSMYKILAS
ncbi:MAG: hypothetical protein IJ213_10055 [Bacteroidales bacterium]|nr:hypothetical protein [Bacteroidales bacterium]